MTLVALVAASAYLVIGLGHSAWHHTRVWSAASRTVYQGEGERISYCLLQLLIACGWPLLDVWDGAQWLRQRHLEVRVWRKLERSAQESYELHLRRQVAELEHAGEIPPERD